ncbi:MAG TPA: response regulator [Ignavibacteriaceae bacterium]|nr:response regulator [Ignavibacteriaceae bacterium]
MNSDTVSSGSRGKKQWDILVIDDEQVIIDAIVKICSSENFSVDSAIDAQIALTKLVKNNYRLIICDIMMPGMDGFEFLDELINRRINSALIMTTGFSTVDNAVRSLYSGAIDFIPKPFTADELLSSVNRGMKYIEIQSLLKTQKDDSAVVYVPCPAKYYRLGYSSWAAEESAGSVLIGATDLFVKTIGNFSSIDLLNPDEELIQGNSCAYFKDQQERIFTLLSPITGRILESNSEIVKDKTLLEKDPYFEGWLYRMLPSDSEYELKKLINCSSDRL